MPSAAKIEKQASLDTNDNPLKQVQVLVDKKIRNLEKRKVKLESLQVEAKSGKELNEDQKNAIKKYDQVVEILEFFRDFNKTVGSIFTEHTKSMKKIVKKESIERQQAETERLKTIVLYQDILENWGNHERESFKNGKNGAIQLSEESLKQLDILYEFLHVKKDDPNVPWETSAEQVSERYIALIEGKNRECIKGATFMEMKDLLQRIVECDYFKNISKTSLKNDENESKTAGDATQSTTKHQNFEPIDQSTHVSFLQESRLPENELPHKDPAVVAVASQHTYPYGIQFPPNDALTAQMATGIPITATSGTQKGNYDNVSTIPSIPTQTFTNQSYTAFAITNPAAQFVPVTLPAGTAMTPMIHAVHPPAQIAPTNPSPHLQTELMQHDRQHNYQDQDYSDFQPENQNSTSQERIGTFQSDENYGQKNYEKGYRGNNPRGRNGPRPQGSNTNGYRNGRGGKGNYNYNGFSGNRENFNGSNYGNSSDKSRSNNQFQNRQTTRANSNRNVGNTRAAGVNFNK